MIVEPSTKPAKGGPILMKRQSDGDFIHILVMPNWRAQLTNSRANSRLVTVPRRRISVFSRSVILPHRAASDRDTLAAIYDPAVRVPDNNLSLADNALDIDGATI
jgi:hypothetical protein